MTQERELTVSEAGRLGNKVQYERHGAPLRKAIGKKGGMITARKYGPDHYRRIGALGGNRTKEKKKVVVGEGRCRKCGTHIDGDLEYLQSAKDKTLCNTCD